MRASLLALLFFVPSQETPALRVEGPKLLDASGKEVLLRGVSIADPHSLGPEFKKEHFELLARSWKSRCVRIPIHPGYWKQKGAAYYDKLIDSAVEWCREFGMYAVIDYHAIGNLKTGKAQKDKPEYDSTMDLARTFWKHVAARHKDKPWVLYEIFNEPMGISWADLKPLSTELVSIVRAAAPDSIVIVSSPDWTYDLRGPAADPIDAKNLMYAWHVYPVRGRGWEPYIGEARKKFPIFVTEWGYDLNGDSVTLGSTEAFGLPFASMMEAAGMHWTAWCWHPQWGPPMLTNWSGGLTPFGGLARRWLAGDRPAPRPALKEANDFAYWLQKIDLAALGASKFDLCIIDPANDGKEFPRNDIEGLKWSPGGPKIVIAYLSIGEAEDYRSYWKKEWAGQKPAWLGPENPDWRGNYKVRYWDDDWQKIVFAALDRLLAQGFDGVYLDVIDAYEFWRQKDKDDQAKGRMMAFVDRISAHGKRKSKGFHVFVQNCEELLEHANYLGVIDGLGREETYFRKGRPNRPTEVTRSQELFDKAVAAGKKVLIVEYVTDPAAINWIHERAKAKGYAAYCPRKELDALVIPSGHEPD